MKKFNTFFIVFTLIILTKNISAQDFVYTPVNPSFGGNPYNASWLLSSAQAQDQTGESQTQRSFLRDPLQDFKETLNRQILSQLTRNLTTSMFGENALTEGRYELGDYIIDIVPVSEGIQINILDINNGSETNIIIPYL